jgi:hypothetical protein
VYIIVFNSPRAAFPLSATPRAENVYAYMSAPLTEKIRYVTVSDLIDYSCIVSWFRGFDTENGAPSVALPDFVFLI